MMDPTGPCSNYSELTHIAIVAMNVLQSIAVAWLANRAYQRDKNGTKRK